MSLEEIPTDRSRLSKKLFKRYQEASPEYIESEEFKKFIEKCKNKLQSKNLYLIAKEVTDELCCRKVIMFLPIFSVAY